MSGEAAQLGSQLRELWERLESEPWDGDKALRTIDTPVKTPFGPVLLGRAPDGRRILVPIPTDTQRTFKEDRRGRALRIVRRQVTTGGGLHWHADLTCLRPELEEVFVWFAVDAIARIDADPTGAITALRKCMSEWRALFAAGGRVLGINELAGLFGELLVLDRLLERTPNSLALWKGPMKERHDFSNGREAVEVKASSAEKGHVFTVHGLDQLEPPSVDGRLVLAHIRLSQSLDGGQSVPELVARCEQLSGTSLAGLLESVGYRRADEDTYRRVSFVVHDQAWYEVGDAFPRITVASFAGGTTPPGVTGVTYDVDLKGLDLAVLDPDEIEAHLANLSSAE